MSIFFQISHICGHKIEYKSTGIGREHLKDLLAKESCPYCKPNCVLWESVLYYYMIVTGELEEIE